MARKLTKLQASLIIRLTKKYLGNAYAAAVVAVFLFFGLIVEVPSDFVQILG